MQSKILWENSNPVQTANFKMSENVYLEKCQERQLEKSVPIK